MGQANAETSLDSGPESEMYLVRIASAIDAVSKYTFWNSNCFAQALCAHWILKQRKHAHTIYFGTKKDDGGGMRAHAWLRAGDKIVTGRKGHLQYVVLGKFAHLPKGDS